MLIIALFILAKVQTQHKCLSTDTWIKNIWFLNTVGYSSWVLEKKIILQNTTTWMNFKDIMLSEICPHKEKHFYLNLWFPLYEEIKSETVSYLVMSNSFWPHGL